MENVKLQESSVIVFAGAGASAELNMPTTPQFVEPLRGTWPRLDLTLEHYRKYREEVGQPKGDNEPIDAEELRDWFMYMLPVTGYAEYLLHNQPFDTKVSDSSYASQFISVLLDKFDSIIRNTFGTVDPEQAYKHYSHLFSVLSEFNIVTIPFFTTNYDLVLESLEEYSECNWVIETGMEKKGTHTYLNTKRFERVSTGLSTLLLFKLHGSTDWWKNTETGRVMQVEFGSTPPPHYKDLLIYPTREKFDQVKEQPFSFLYDMLNHYLSSNVLRLCIAIGYSFRDSLINNRFRDAMKKGLRLLIIDPYISRVQLQQVFGDREIMKQVRIENIGFGNWTDPKRERLAKVLSEELRTTTRK